MSLGLHSGTFYVKHWQQHFTFPSFKRSYSSLRKVKLLHTSCHLNGPFLFVEIANIFQLNNILCWTYFLYFYFSFDFSLFPSSAPFYQLSLSFYLAACLSFNQLTLFLSIINFIPSIIRVLLYIFPAILSITSVCLLSYPSYQSLHLSSLLFYM